MKHEPFTWTLSPSRPSGAGMWPAAMTYGEAIQHLCGLQMFGAKLGLEPTRRLAALAGHPERSLRFIHVAGTNGKGSTCAMLESIHRAAGRRVGLYTSPHLVSFAERIQINRVPIPPAELARRVSALRAWLDEFPSDDRPTFFEAVTVLALRYFADEHCELVIWETGLGGRLDATNIVTPVVSVITGIDMDHQAWLGTTHDAIAAEKAGILKAGIPAVTGAAPGRGLEVIEATARRLGSALTVVREPERLLQPLGPGLEIGLSGAHQRHNAAVAVATVRLLSGPFPVTEAAVREGLGHVSWPGRLQVVLRPGGGMVVLDGAHNPAGAEALVKAWRERWPTVRPALILGALADKDWFRMAHVLTPLARRVLLVPVKSARALSAEDLATVCRDLPDAPPVISCPRLSKALAEVTAEPHVLIAGSLYLVGEAMEQLGAAPALPADERRLNEWGAVSHARTR